MQASCQVPFTLAQEALDTQTTTLWPLTDHQALNRDREKATQHLVSGLKSVQGLVLKYFFSTFIIKH